MEILQGVWKQHLRPPTVVGYGVKIFRPSPPNYVTSSPGYEQVKFVLLGDSVGVQLSREPISYNM